MAFVHRQRGHGIGPHFLNATNKGGAGHPGEGHYVVLWFSVENEVLRAAASQTQG